MKNWLTLLCLGIIALAAYQKRDWWTPYWDALTAPAPAVVTTPPTAAPTAPAAPAAPAANPPGPVAIAPAANPPGPGGAVAPNPVPTAPAATPEVTLADRVAESRRAALAKYPDLGNAGAEINTRFVYRFKLMQKEHSNQLQDPNWPLELADECAATIKGGVQHVSMPMAAAVQNATTDAADLTVTLPSGKVVTFQTADQKARFVASLIRPKPGAAPETVAANPGAAAGHEPLFVTMDAVNKSSSNHFSYNWYSGWGDYDISFRQSVGVAVTLRNMSRAPTDVTLRWMFFARRNAATERYVFACASKDLTLGVGDSSVVDIDSPMIQSREYTDYYYTGVHYLYGSKYEGWLVQVVPKGSEQVLKQTGSTSYIEDLAKNVGYPQLLAAYKTQAHVPK